MRKVPVELFYSWVCLFSPYCQGTLTVSLMELYSWENLQYSTGQWQQECKSAFLHPSTCTAGCDCCSNTAKRRGGGAKKQKCQVRGQIETQFHKVLAKHLFCSAFTTLYLGVWVIVETCKGVIIVARTFIILVCGHIGYSYKQKHRTFASVICL